MCGRYIVVSKIDKIKKRFDVGSNLVSAPLLSNFNVSPGDQSLVITSEKPQDLQLYRFGMRPHWAKKPMYLINARSEGDFNKENDVKYHGQMGIRNKPSFRKPFRSQRCLVIADAFIEGTVKEKLNKPFVVYPIHKSERPFAFAGLYDHWVDKQTGEITSSYSIITSVATPLLQKLPHHRSPVILRDRNEELTWLDVQTSVSDLETLLRPPNALNFNAYPISNTIKNSRIKDLSLIQPKGDRILPEYEYVIHNDLELVGMGMTPSRKRKMEE